MSKELDYGEVIGSYYERAEKQGKVSTDPADAWIRVDPGQIWWPNPNYTGPEIIHPELRT